MARVGPQRHRVEKIMLLNVTSVSICTVVARYIIVAIILLMQSSVLLFKRRDTRGSPDYRQRCLASLIPGFVAACHRFINLFYNVRETL